MSYALSELTVPHRLRESVIAAVPPAQPALNVAAPLPALFVLPMFVKRWIRRILAVALNIAAEGKNVTLVTKDMPLRVKAASVGLELVPAWWVAGVG